MHAALHAQALFMALIAAELASWPSEQECRACYELAARVETKINAAIEICGPTLPLLDAQRRNRWHKDFWWACWWVAWPPASLDQRLHWLGVVNDLRRRVQ